MDTLKQVRKTILSASFSGLQSATSAASPEGPAVGELSESVLIDLRLKRATGEVVKTLMATATDPNGRLFMAVAVGLFLLVLTVALVRYSAADDTSEKQEVAPTTSKTVQAEDPDTKVLDEASLASESDEVPKLRRSARIRAKEAQASKKDL